MEFSARFAQAATLDLDIVPIGVPDEAEGVDVLCLEIHRMHIAAASTVNDAADFLPDRCHRAHAAGLERRV